MMIDANLPGLQVGLELQTITKLLRPLWRTEPGIQPVVMGARMLEHKPGLRALIQYDVALGNGCSCTVLAKLYSNPEQAAQVARATQWLWDHTFFRGQLLGMPRPLGLISALAMLVYIPAEGQFLDEVLASDEAVEAMGLTGAWLSHLHRQSMPLEKRFQIDNELGNLQLWAALVNQTYPETAEATAPLLRHLQACAPVLRFETQTPIHKDFHYRHVLVHRGVKVIDFDEIRLGDPTFDLAHFCANLHLLSYRRYGRPNHYDRLQQVFLDAYTRRTRWVRDERFPYFYVYTCLKIAKQLCTMRGPQPRPEGEERRGQVRMLLEQGLEVL
jgi:hypothetical protein